MLRRSHSARTHSILSCFEAPPARHSYFSMRGSAVALGFKSLASKINSQAPLGAKESSRFLDALTSSFRKHLDEVHPNQQHDEEQPSAGQDSSKHVVHSSAAMADMHMASMLTNPLFAKSTSPRAKPKPTSQQANSKTGFRITESNIAIDENIDPLNPFESAQSKGHATVDMAATCIWRFRQSLLSLPYENSIVKIHKHKVGARVFSWLINSKFMESQELANSEQFQIGLVWLLMKEGHEELVFRWLEADMRLPRPSSRPIPDSGDDQSSDYFWKRTILYAMVRTKLSQPLRRSSRPANSALSVYFRGADSMHKYHEDAADELVATSRARYALVQALCRGSLHQRTDPSHYDEFVSVHANFRRLHVSSVLRHQLEEFCHAKLQLWHPVRPSADDFYTLTSRETGVGHDRARDLLQRLKDDTPSIIANFTRAAQLSEAAENPKQSQELLCMANKLFPSETTNITESLAHMRSLKSTVRKQEDLEPERQRETPSSKQRRHQQEQQQNSHWLSQYFPATT